MYCNDALLILSKVLSPQKNHLALISTFLAFKALQMKVCLDYLFSQLYTFVQNIDFELLVTMILIGQEMWYDQVFLKLVFVLSIFIPLHIVGHPVNNG